MNICQFKYLIYVLFRVMKFYVCEYKTQGNPVTFPIVENITLPIQFPKEFDVTIHINNLFSYKLEQFLVFRPRSDSFHHVLWEAVKNLSPEFVQQFAHNISSS